ncbi:MAG: hypothetical protein L0387_44690 [Acidobacteria bacterium]|nr:hypothetical protein [Acidobacteriota bacterium]MCI0720762.1 hypothetical protein [Acidobacteriota bacterium]
MSGLADPVSVRNQFEGAGERVAGLRKKGKSRRPWELCWGFVSRMDDNPTRFHETAAPFVKGDFDGVLGTGGK